MNAPATFEAGSPTADAVGGDAWFLMDAALAHLETKADLNPWEQWLCAGLKRFRDDPTIDLGRSLGLVQRLSHEKETTIGRYGTFLIATLGATPKRVPAVIVDRVALVMSGRGRDFSAEEKRHIANMRKAWSTKAIEPPHIKTVRAHWRAWRMTAPPIATEQQGKISPGIFPCE